MACFSGAQVYKSACTKGKGNTRQKERLPSATQILESGVCNLKKIAPPSPCGRLRRRYAIAMIQQGKSRAQQESSFCFWFVWLLFITLWLSWW